MDDLTSPRNRPPKPKRIQLAVDIRKDQQEALQELLPYGTQKPVMQFIIDELITLLSSPEGKGYLGAFMKGKLSLRDILALNRMGEDGAETPT